MLPSKAVMDTRAAEKLRAMREGRTPVFVAEPALPTGNTPEDLDARWRAKMEARKAAKPAQAEAVEEAAKPEGDGEPEVDVDALAKEIAALNKAQIAERIKADFGLDVDKDSVTKDKLVELYLEEAAKLEGDG